MRNNKRPRVTSLGNYPVHWLAKRVLPPAKTSRVAKRQNDHAKVQAFPDPNARANHSLMAKDAMGRAIDLLLIQAKINTC
jgi:hypothetical protein